MLEKFNIETKRDPRILLAPLDWGLGHATRCIPLIRHLVKSGCEVIIAAEGKQEQLLRLEFPSIRMVCLKGYRLKYSNNRWKTIVKIVLQVPRILQAARSEHLWLSRFCKEERIDAIISDNRYGFFLSGVASVYITHQLAIKTPFGRIGDRLVRFLNYKAVENFDRCWVPDLKTHPNLAGDLSHPLRLPAIPVSYIGPLSRFEDLTSSITGSPILVLLSGPEPQRSVFESLILTQLSTIDEDVIIVRGLPGGTSFPELFLNNVKVYNHLPANQMAEVVSRAGIVISRSGYSTVMEMLLAGKDCIFVPTPGQSEQEYLAKYLSGSNFCVSATQGAFSLAALVAQLKGTKLTRFSATAGPDKEVIDAFVDLLKAAPKI